MWLCWTGLGPDLDLLLMPLIVACKEGTATTWGHSFHGRWQKYKVNKNSWCPLKPLFQTDPPSAHIPFVKAYHMTDWAQGQWGLAAHSALRGKEGDLIPWGWRWGTRLGIADSAGHSYEVSLMCFDMCSHRFNCNWDGSLSMSFNLGSVCHSRTVKEENPSH